MVDDNLTASEKSHVRLVYVGAAAAGLADRSSRWVTNPKDWVINSLRTLSFANNWAQPLAWNVNESIFSTMNHNFIGYVNNYP